MREIKFKAIRKGTTNEWLIGDLNHIEGKVYIFDRSENAPLNSPDWFEVIPETVCQYLGKLDGFDLYECDVLAIGENLIGVLNYVAENINDYGDETSFAYHIKLQNHNKNIPFDEYVIKYSTILGNIHTTHKHLKQGKL